MSKRGVYGLVAVAGLIVVAGVIVIASRKTRVPDNLNDRLRSVRRAETFLKDIGVKANHFETAKLELPDSDAKSGYLGSVEEVKWENVSVEVGRNTGTVCSYFDHRKATDPGGPLAVRDKAAALARAQLILSASGKTSDLGAPKVHAYNSPTQGVRFSVRWPRMYGTIPYFGQNAEVVVGETGETDFVIRFGSKTQPRGSVRLSKAEAVITAAKCLRDNKVPNIPLQSARVYIVEPNRKWRPPNSVPPPPKIKLMEVPRSFPNDPGGKKAMAIAMAVKLLNASDLAKESALSAPIGGAPRIAWVCKYETRRAKGNHRYEVWVDAESGQIEGGMAWDLD